MRAVRVGQCTARDCEVPSHDWELHNHSSQQLRSAALNSVFVNHWLNWQFKPHKFLTQALNDIYAVQTVKLTQCGHAAGC
jgi:hypothetical protein